MNELFQQSFKQGQLNAIGLIFVQQMTPENDFHYAGEDVVLGDGETPICWYKPTGADVYRVTYGDLSVREVAPEDVPSVDPE